jgi:hypothetical protein
MTARTDTSAEFPSMVVTMQSSHDFEATVSRLKAALAAHGVTLFAEIDQSAAAADAGMPLRPWHGNIHRLNRNVTSSFKTQPYDDVTCPRP